MSMYLFDDTPIVVNTTLANEIGLNEAIVLQQINYWIEINKRAGKNYYDGKYWTYNSIKSWHEKNFKFLSVETVRRVFTKLEKSGFIITGNYNKDPRDKTKWYTINDKKLEELYFEVEDRKKRLENEKLKENGFTQTDNVDEIYEPDTGYFHVPINFYVLNGDYGVCGFTYQPEIEQYISLNGCGGSNTDSFVREVVSARQEGNFLYITEKSIYIYADWNETITRKYIYNNCQQDKMLDYQETPSTESHLVELDDYIEEAATYEYVFENQNGQYIFKEFHPV